MLLFGFRLMVIIIINTHIYLPIEESLIKSRLLLRFSIEIETFARAVFGEIWSLESKKRWTFDPRLSQRCVSTDIAHWQSNENSFKLTFVDGFSFTPLHHIKAVYLRCSAPERLVYRVKEVSKSKRKLKVKTMSINCSREKPSVLWFHHARCSFHV
jgi:uncharacterized protein YndB with AHSA1/START domain